MGRNFVWTLSYPIISILIKSPLIKPRNLDMAHQSVPLQFAPSISEETDMLCQLGESRLCKGNKTPNLGAFQHKVLFVAFARNSPLSPS